MTETLRLENIAIVLHQPRFPENIGAAARAMCNMGIRRLIVVNPENCDLTRVLRMATHAALDVVEEMEVFKTLPEALAPFSYVVGTTARLGGKRPVRPSPAALAEHLISISMENQIAVLFGPEDRGLTNEDILFCHELVNIPTADFSSLNLAQAVMVLCYELFNAERAPRGEFSPRMATRHELDGMYDQLKDILLRIDYIKPDNPDYWLNKLRHFFTRIQLRARDVSIIRGICRQVDWYAGKCYRDGQKSAEDSASEMNADLRR
ncbi:MAG: RNA methyltransferase [Desulfobacterales bacterium]|jgi:tRNA/rRNA methyltransferase|nr:RNA methyltransferase [Desulfobacterales bacterium]